MALRWWISVLLMVMVTTCNQVQGGMKGANALDSHLPMPRGTLKTIETEYGEIIDCVDIYQQPALTNPLLKDQQLQMKPSSIPRGIKLEDESYSILNLVGTWSCPEGTVPIPRPLKYDSTATNLQKIKSFNVSNDNAQEIHKYAAVTYSHTSANIHGVSAAVNVWNPTVEAKDLSIAQLWITNGLSGHPFESLEAGWLIDPAHDPNHETRLFIYYTNDGYKTPCYNLDCGGFVVTSSTVVIGTVLKPYSVYNGDQTKRTIAIIKDPVSKNWWFHYEGVAVGYWPASLFKGLSTAANGVQWGGEVVEAPTSTHPTKTQMGSGRFANEDFRKAAYIGSLFYLDANQKTIVPSSVTYKVTHPNCYTITTLSTDSTGGFFYYGGPGGTASACTS